MNIIYLYGIINSGGVCGGVYGSDPFLPYAITPKIELTIHLAHLPLVLITFITFMQCTHMTGWCNALRCLPA